MTTKPLPKERFFYDSWPGEPTDSYFAPIFKIQIVKTIKAAGAFFAHYENEIDF